MPKLSKRKRKLLKEKEEQNKNIIHGIPYSKHKTYTCNHLDEQLHHVYSLIDSHGICKKCKHKFTNEEIESMGRYINYMNSTPDFARLRNLENELLPDSVEYYYGGPNSIVEIQKNRRNVFPTKVTKYKPKTVIDMINKKF